MKIEFVLFDGFDDLDAIAPYEVLRHAAHYGAPFDPALVGVDGPGTVTSAHGVSINLGQGLGTPDAVIVPGGGWLDHAASGSWAEAQRGTLPAKLAALAGRVQWFGSVCTGAMLLAEAGLLTGRAATTNRNAWDALAAGGAVVLPHRVVDDGDIITAGGLTSGIDLALWVTERWAGAGIAAKTAAALEYRPWNEVWTRPQTVGAGK